MDQSEKPQENQQTEQPAILPVQSPETSKTDPWKYLATGLTVVLVALIAYYFISTRHQALNNTATIIPSPVPTMTSATNPTETQTIKTFEDSRLEGMKFTYDPSRWDVIQFSGKDQAIINELKFVGSGILLRDKHSNDKLIMEYTLPFGMEGGIHLVTQDSIVKLSSNLIREKFKDTNMYNYGLSNVLILFTSSPKDYEQFLAACKTEREKPGEQPELLDTQDCNDLESKKAIGFLEFPTFNYSLHFKNLVGFKDINTAWENEPDKGYVIVEISYQGSNPTYADDIVQQIVK